MPKCLEKIHKNLSDLVNFFIKQGYFESDVFIEALQAWQQKNSLNTKDSIPKEDVTDELLALLISRYLQADNSPAYWLGFSLLLSLFSPKEINRFVSQTQTLTPSQKNTFESNGHFTYSKSFFNEGMRVSFFDKHTGIPQDTIGDINRFLGDNAKKALTASNRWTHQCHINAIFSKRDVESIREQSHLLKYWLSDKKNADFFSSLFYGNKLASIANFKTLFESEQSDIECKFLCVYMMGLMASPAKRQMMAQLQDAMIETLENEISLHSSTQPPSLIRTAEQVLKRLQALKAAPVLNSTDDLSNHLTPDDNHLLPAFIALIDKIPDVPAELFQIFRSAMKQYGHEKETSLVLFFKQLLKKSTKEQVQLLFNDMLGGLTSRYTLACRYDAYEKRLTHIAEYYSHLSLEWRVDSLLPTLKDGNKQKDAAARALIAIVKKMEKTQRDDFYTQVDSYKHFRTETTMTTQLMVLKQLALADMSADPPVSLKFVVVRLLFDPAAHQMVNKKIQDLIFSTFFCLLHRETGKVKKTLADLFLDKINRKQDADFFMDLVHHLMDTTSEERALIIPSLVFLLTHASKPNHSDAMDCAIDEQGLKIPACLIDFLCAAIDSHDAKDQDATNAFCHDIVSFIAHEPLPERLINKLLTSTSFFYHPLFMNYRDKIIPLNNLQAKMARYLFSAIDIIEPVDDIDMDNTISNSMMK